MSQSKLYKRLNEIDNWHDLAGTDDANDQLDVDVVQSLLAAALSSNGTDSLLVQEDTPLDVSAATVTSSPAVLSSVTHGQDTTGSANTEAALNGGTSLSVPNGATLRLKALSGNGGSIYVGAAGSVSTSNGYELAAGEAVYLAVDDVSDVAIIDGSGGFGVSWVVEQ